MNVEIVLKLEISKTKKKCDWVTFVFPGFLICNEK